MIAPSDILSPTFSGHESFTLRYGWLTKAFQAVFEDPDALSKDDAMVALGVGKNMVRSIRFWALNTNIIATTTDGRRSSLEPTLFGKSLLSQCGYDPYLEDPSSLWLIHWQLASRPEGPTTWYWTFNELQEPEFTRERLLFHVEEFIARAGWKSVANTTLKRDIDCFLRTYVSSTKGHQSNGVLEDTLDSPLAELGIIGEVRDSDAYYFQRGRQATLSSSVVTYAILDYWERIELHRKSLVFDRVAYHAGSPGRVFKLDEASLINHLEALEEITDGAIVFDSTAGMKQLLKRRDIEAAGFLTQRILAKQRES